MTESKTTAGNLNTILLAIVLGVLSWVGYTTQNTSVALAVVVEKNSNHDRELLDLRTRLSALEIQMVQLRRSYP